MVTQRDLHPPLTYMYMYMYNVYSICRAYILYM